MPSRVPLYCSHSYRPADRDLNIHFWKLFHDANFSFTVDPKSTVLSTTSLELMMARSAGFVAVVTYRPGVPIYECSPFMVHEFGLAFQARKPRIVLRDKRVSPRYFNVGDTVDIAFDVDNLDRSSDELKAALETFHKQTSALQAGLPYRRGRVGVALPAGDRRDAVERMVHITGDTPEDLWKIAHDPFALALNAESCDYVIVDLDDPAAVHVGDFLQGRATPLLKMAWRGDGADLPLRLLGTAPLREVAAAGELVMYWDNPDEFESRLLREVNRARVGRQEFASFEAGHRYFRSLGREALPVFVSNANSTNDLALALTEAMSLDNIPYFHYRFNNTIGLGRQWADELAKRVAASKVFVMLINATYWESDWCRREYEVATSLAEKGRITVVPFLLEGYGAGPELPDQGKDLRGKTPEEQVRTVVHELDGLFVAAETIPASVAEESDSVAAGEASADIAIVTILKEEYDAVLRCLSNKRSVAGTDAYPNVHSWTVGEIYSPVHKASFSVVLALSSHAGASASLIAAKNTILAFEPRYVLVVGVAGGLGKVKLGDVVVANRICAYEYGKIDHGFHPRDSLDSPTDGSLAGAALTLESRHSLWYQESDQLRSKPTIHVGHVASGDKVVDDRSDAFFQAVMDSRPTVIAVEMEGAGVAAAIQDARELQRQVGFGMIRGISDVPREGGSLPGEQHGQSAQTEIRDSMKYQASAAAAICAAQLIRHAWPRPPRERPRR